MDLNLGFFASHNGSNVAAILNDIFHKRLEAAPKVIISNNPDARVLKIAKVKGIPNYCLNKKRCKDLDTVIIETLQRHDVNLVLLAGYLKKISADVIKEYENRILNIHPSLLPKYGGIYGKSVHQAVIDSDDQESGATVHLVTPKYDKGRILAQVKVSRYELDKVETLSQRVLKFEHVLYSQVLRDIKRGLIDLDSKDF